MLRVLTSTISSFLPTLVILVLVGLVLQVLSLGGPLENYILGAFFALVHQFVEKYKEIKRRSASQKRTATARDSPYRANEPRRKTEKQGGATWVGQLSEFLYRMALAILGWLVPRLAIMLVALIVVSAISTLVFLIWSRLVF